MAKDESTPLPHFDSLDKLVESFDTQDWGEHVEQMPKADFEVDLKRKIYLIALEADLTEKVEELARSRHTSPEGLINSWVREKLLGQS